MCKHLLVTESLFYSDSQKRILGFFQDQNRAVLLKSQSSLKEAGAERWEALANRAKRTRTG